jgi:hypothetical protein
LLYHLLDGGFDPTAPPLWFFLRNNWFPPGRLLSSHCSTRGLGLELLRQSTDLRSNVDMRLFDFGLNRLIEESGNLLNRSILRCLFSVRAFHRQTMDLGGEGLQ